MVQFTTYKAENAGKLVVQVNPYNTSQKCSNCGILVKKSLSVCIHTCTCGYEDDRDVNAAKNILQLGLEKIKASLKKGEELAFAESTGLLGSMKRETLKSVSDF